MSVIEKPWGKIVVDDATGASTAIVRDRTGYVQDPDFSLEPDSLVGSAFLVLVGGEVIWQGLVVAEPQAGRYLTHLNRLEAGADNVQRVFTLDTLLGLGEDAKRLVEGAIAEMKVSVVDPAVEWRFYDNVEAARSAFLAIDATASAQ